MQPLGAELSADKCQGAAHRGPRDLADRGSAGVNQTYPAIISQPFRSLLLSIPPAPTLSPVSSEADLESQSSPWTISPLSSPRATRFSVEAGVIACVLDFLDEAR